MAELQSKLSILQASLTGELYTDSAMRTLYATDASVYREMPLAVALPQTREDLVQLIHFARTEGSSLIPRTAGTSLAGQCVGEGIVVDVSRHFNRILEVNAEEGWVRLEPGVIRDDLNKQLEPLGRFFGPNTSTANRAMIGGMVGNNSCGSYSIVYGTTRDHVLELSCLLSDGSEAVFGELTAEAFAEKCSLQNREGEIYRQLRDELTDPQKAADIRAQFPAPGIHRRNTGYAVDVLLESEVFTPEGAPFNVAKLICGSEGTLALITEIKIHVDPLPPAKLGLLCAHFPSVREALDAVLLAMEYQPRAVELMDKVVMDCTKGNLMYAQNRFFIEGDPQAVLIIEIGGEREAEIKPQLDAIAAAMQAAGKGYHFPQVYGPDIGKVWNLRKAGLGLLANVPGDAKPVAVIEDTAVKLADLPAYIEEFGQMMDGYGQQAVYYAHAGAGELHLRPILDLKKSKDRKLFRDIGRSTAELVKKYQGSLSGEHGDGRVRAEFIPLMIGEDNYALLRRLKAAWDPRNIFNPGKIVDAPPMDAALRYEPEQETRTFDTVMDFSATDGILRAAEKCNGSGDCRKSHLSGGTMCPSFMATRHEKDTTRARANILREVLTRSNADNPFADPDIYEVMDLCLSCKGCASECPSNVNVATLKAEFLHQYYKEHGIPLRAQAFARIGQLNRLGALVPGLTNLILNGKLTSGLLKRLLKVAPKRALPALQQTTLRRWWKRHGHRLSETTPRKGSVWLFCDEFTDLNDTHIGIKTVELLTRLGYEVRMTRHAESGRAPISKGMLRMARRMAIYNVEAFAPLVSADTPLLGIEPSAILGFRDEYPKLVPAEMREQATELGRHALTVEEFLARELANGQLSPRHFTDAPKQVLLHGHCHQKALSSLQPTVDLLSLPVGYTVETIPSGCCGMAGSFGYEAEHYELSMQVGELVLFPSVRQAETDTLIAAPGTSCRHQIADGTGRQAQHPIEILHAALRGD